MLLQGKKALVTGGSRGIGAAVAKAFVAEGAQVVYTYINSAETQQNELPQAIAIQCDGRNASQVEKTVKEALDLMGGIDILVNNAGITKDGLLLRMSESDWDEVVDVNLKSAFLFSKAVLKTMMRTGGSIIHMSSVVGINGNAGQSNYAASKAGLIGFSKSLAQEMGSRNVRSNVIAPGFIQTEMTAKLTDSVLENQLHQIPLKRLGNTDDVAQTAIFLASDRSSYITGQVISVCGGLNR